MAVNFLTALCIQDTKQPKYKKLALFLGIAFNVVWLVYFKYANFLIVQGNQLFRLLGLNTIPLINVILPLAVSFYTFQQISYLVDIYRGEKASRDPLEFALFVSLFPKLIAGPIVRWNELASQIRQRSESSALFFEGAYRFVIGLAQKVILADVLGSFVSQVHDQGVVDIPMLRTWFLIFEYTFQIYFDFAGYTNMAIGLGKMLGFTFPENFNRPYLSKSITEFWRRWHMTLSRFLRDYIYIPLGGNRCSNFRNAINIIIVFTIGGIWHGAGLHFLCWGFYYGILLAGEKHVWGGLLKRFPAFLQTAVTFVLVMIGWVFFWADSLKIAVKMLFNMFIPRDLAFFIRVNDKQLIATLILAMVITFFPAIKNANLSSFFQRAVFIKGVIVLLLFFISAVLLATGSFKAFIYQQF